MRRFILIVLALVFPISVLANEGQISSDIRKEYIHRAQIWRPVDISKMDMIAGPQSEFSVPFDSEVVCSFVTPKEKLSGASPKFDCKTANGQVIRVKYGSFESYAEVIASRLVWALGFYADEVYPVRIKCLDCPEDPFQFDEKSPRFVRVFSDAIIERRFPGVSLEQHDDQGWNWTELEKVQKNEGGATRAQIDALKLLSVLIQHADTKPDNQRLACYQDDLVKPRGEKTEYCRKPVLMIQDLGSTFGSGAGVLHLSKMNFNEWKSAEIFNTREEADLLFEKGQRLCVGKVTSNHVAGPDGLNDPLISEAGREFLAGLLNQLSDQQIHDLFFVGRVEYLQEYVEENGSQRKVTVDDWAQEFARKRAEINESHCSEEKELMVSREEE